MIKLGLSFSSIIKSPLLTAAVLFTGCAGSAAPSPAVPPYVSGNAEETISSSEEITVPEITENIPGNIPENIGADELFASPDDKILSEIADLENNDIYEMFGEIYIMFVPGSGYSVFRDMSAFAEFDAACSLTEKAYRNSEYEARVSYEEYKDIVREKYGISGADPVIPEKCVLFILGNNGAESISDAEMFPAVFRFVTDRLRTDADASAFISEKTAVEICVLVWEEESSGGGENQLSLVCTVYPTLLAATVFPVTEDEVYSFGGSLSLDGETLTENKE